MPRLKRLANVVYWLIFAVIMAVALFVGLSLVRVPVGYRLFMVLSSSMEPTIRAGSVVLVIPKDTYKRREIITFSATPGTQLGRLNPAVTHRIIQVKDEEGRRTYRTIGDANEEADREPVEKEQIIGRIVLAVPYAGYLASFAKTQKGFILLIVIPATLVVSKELTSIKQEFLRLVNQRKAKA